PRRSIGPSARRDDPDSDSCGPGRVRVAFDFSITPMERCKARSKQTGQQCKRVGKSVCPTCGVCSSHGCNCAHPGGRPPVHGLYSAHVDAELAALIEESSGHTDLEQEIRLLRALVKR